MADTNGSNKGSLGQPPEQMSTETRLLLAFLLMGAIMFLTPYFFKPQTPSPAAKKATQPGASQATVPPTPQEAQAPAVSPEADKTPPTVPVTQAPTLPPVIVNTDLY